MARKANQLGTGYTYAQVNAPGKVPRVKTTETTLTYTLSDSRLHHHAQARHDGRFPAASSVFLHLAHI